MSDSRWTCEGRVREFGRKADRAAASDSGEVTIVFDGASTEVATGVMKQLTHATLSIRLGWRAQESEFLRIEEDTWRDLEGHRVLEKFGGLVPRRFRLTIEALPFEDEK